MAMGKSEKLLIRYIIYAMAFLNLFMLFISIFLLTEALRLSGFKIASG